MRLEHRRPRALGNFPRSVGERSNAVSLDATCWPFSLTQEKEDSYGAWTRQGPFTNDAFYAAPTPPCLSPGEQHKGWARIGRPILCNQNQRTSVKSGTCRNVETKDVKTLPPGTEEHTLSDEGSISRLPAPSCPLGTRLVSLTSKV